MHLTHPQVRQLREQLNATLAAFAKTHGYHAIQLAGSVSFDPSRGTFRARIEGAKVISAAALPTGNIVREQDYNRYRAMNPRLPALGECVTINGKAYKIVGKRGRSAMLELNGKEYRYALARLPGKTTIQLSEKEAWQQLVKLVGELSPENLTCDGELPRSKVEAKRRQILAEWAILERRLGRQVTEDEVWSWYQQNRDQI